MPGAETRGRAERGVGMMKAMVRTVKSALERRYDIEIVQENPVYGWMVMHACELWNNYQRGTDGKTTRQR